MQQREFWRLYGPKSPWKWARWDNNMDIETVTCPVEIGHQRSGRRSQPLSIVLPESQVPDFVWTWHKEVLLRDRTLEVLRAAGVTGFEVRPAKARFKHRGEHEPPRLHEMIVTGWGGVAPPEAGFKCHTRCDACGLLQYTYGRDMTKLIERSQWDGSDVFIVWPLPQFVLITDRVAQLIDANCLKGLSLRPPDVLEFVPHGIGGSRLSYWMPAERARELGGPLGID